MQTSLNNILDSDIVLKSIQRPKSMKALAKFIIYPIELDMFTAGFEKMIGILGILTAPK